MKKVVWGCSIFSLLFLSLYTSRHFILETALEFGLKKAAQDAVAYNSRYWEEGKLKYEGFSLGQQLYAEEVSFDFDFHFFPLSIDADVHLSAPTIQVGGGENKAPNLSFLVPTKFCTVKLDIEKGRLISAENNLCIFDFASGDEKEEMGRLSVFQDDGVPLFTCGFNYRDESLAADFEMDEAPLSKTLPLAALFTRLPTWKSPEGTASASLKGTVDIEEVTSLQGQLSLQNVRLESEDIILAVDKASSQIDFQGEMETFALDTDFNGVDLFWKELEVLQGEGSIVFKPQETPTFEAHAAVHLADLEGRADLVGKGEFHENQSLWMEGTLDYVTAKNPLKIDFTWADDGKSQVLQTEIHNLGKEILALFPSWKIKEGRVDGGATLYLAQGIFEHLQLDHIQVHQLAIDQLTVQEVELQGSVNLLSGDIEQLLVQAQDIEGQYQGWDISSAHGTFSIKDNDFEPSSAFGKFEGVPFAVQFQGPPSAFHASAKLSAGASEWLKLSKNPQEPPVILDVILDRKEEELQVSGTLACLEDTIQLNAQGNISNASVKGSFQTSRLQSSFYMPFLKIFAPTLAVQGDLSLRGQFSEKTVDILTRGDGLAIASPEFLLSIPGQSCELLYHFDFKEKKGTGKGKLPSLLFTSQQIPISITGGDLVFDNTSLACQAMTGEISGIQIQGDLTANWEDKLEASFLSQKVEGSIENLLTTLAPFYHSPFDLKGRFTCPPAGALVYYADGKFHTRFQAALAGIEGALTPQIPLQNTSCSLSFDSLENHFVVQNLQGTLYKNITFSAQEIDYKNGEWGFDAAFDQDASSLLSLQGKAVETPEGYQVVLNEGKASTSYLKGPLSFHWSPPSKIDQVRGLVYIDAENLMEQLTLLDQLGLFEFSPSVKEVLENLQGTMTLRLIIDADRSEYEIKGSEIRYASSHFNTIEVHLIREGNEWSLRQCSLDDMKIQGDAAYHHAKWMVSALDIDWKDLHLHTSGIYEKEKFDFKMEGKFTHYLLNGAGLFFASTPHFQNLSFKVLDQNDPLAFLHCENLKWQAGKWESPVVDLTVYSKQLVEPLKTHLKVSLSSASSSFQGPVSQGEVQVGKGSLKIKQIYGLYEAPYLNLKCTAALDDEPLHFLGKFSKDHQFGGGVNIQKGKELLKISLSDPLTCQKAEGELFGINLNLQREPQGFKGTILLKDGAKLADLTDNESLKDLSGMQLTGLFSKVKDDWTFKGELEGHEARLKDYLVQELHANVDYSPTRFRLKNITVQDPAGSLVIKECNGFRSAIADKWNVTIPLLKGQEIRPSAIRKLGSPQKEIKPLQIRYFVMTDVLGQLGDLNSFRGLGTFNFTQRVKKEPSFFDIPLAMLKNLGLDLDMFSPVMGEVKLQLKDGKLFFTDLQNAFSEGKRSEFYLAGEPSYIDLNGGLHLNLRMQQNVVLKLVEPFMIAVRGTWEKPKYSLQ